MLLICSYVTHKTYMNCDMGGCYRKDIGGPKCGFWAMSNYWGSMALFTLPTVPPWTLNPLAYACYWIVQFFCVEIYKLSRQQTFSDVFNVALFLLITVHVTYLRVIDFSADKLVSYLQTWWQQTSYSFILAMTLSQTINIDDICNLLRFHRKTGKWSLFFMLALSC